jgi:hypothetical protein
VRSASPSHLDWGEPAALLAATAVFFSLENRYTLGGPAVTLTLGLILLAFCIASFVATVRATPATTRRMMRIAAAVMAAGLVASVAQVVDIVLYGTGIDAIRLLATAVFIWVINVIVFAIVYHWLGEAEFQFPRGERDSMPLNFLDFLFLSFTTSTAFSATDAPPLTTRARMFMMLEASLSLITIAVAAARAVNILA